jgi:hypothetical protein
MLEGNYFLKAKIEKERILFNEKKPFKEKQNVIKEFF